jgi:transcriptional regulator with XRE-family HTH domain
MGRSSRPVPEQLADKLYLIRQHQKLTQEKMVECLQAKLDEHYQSAKIYPGHISDYEKGKREPPLVVLLAYARIAGVSIDVLADDGQQLPGFYFMYVVRKSTRERLKRERAIEKAMKSQKTKKPGSSTKKANSKTKGKNPK